MWKKSRKTPLLFPHFVTLQPYFKMDEIVCFFISHQTTHNTPSCPSKKLFIHLCKCLKKINKLNEHSHKYSDPLFSTLLKHHWQRLQPWIFLGNDTTSMAHLYLGVFSADRLKHCQVGWGASLQSYFQVSPEMLDRVQVWALAGPLKDIEPCPEASPAFSWLCG